ncbi:peptide chain release factor N(5)-glutamine methyltransferase [Anaeromicrobium sediminis]|uniref:Release factor glutamine methyltransferase n=1 Tax=Anaeromicrobium sediminis TaxID=1478221 RepID=A0A267MFF5_9FIRM|nr:peptide chain release factor N(5)-glutamine methyltransferase [Anaeromicrobium sediminis]PAB58314.1 protein-(glutamine-N5) methyltransferase, release factor-specific [Anaeromicrobium sediminis]
MVTIKEALELGFENLERVRTPLLDAEVLLCNIIKKDRLFLIINKNNILSEDEYSKYMESIEKRKSGIPLQYITNNQEFMGMDFYVETGVLVPRPDTEILVEAVIDWAKKNETKSILELGVGSGAVIISLGKFTNATELYGVDISDIPLKVAGKNAKNNLREKEIKFLKGDLFTPIDEDSMKKLDIIVSNPPYIPKKHIDDLQIEVSKYEPRLALDGGEDGLDFYRKIVRMSPNYLREEGLVAFEVGHDQGQLVADLFKNDGRYENIEKIKDLSGIERVVMATLIKK